MIRYASCVWELQMPTTFRAYQPDQPLLLPLDLQEWVPPGHLAHHVSDVVDALDLTAFYAPNEGDGRRNAPYEPSMMVKVLIYAYATGTFSSRAVARKLEEDVAFRMLAAGNFPQHRTVCEFRRRHLAEFSELFVGVVQVAREMGLARFGKLSVDGTKVRANASKRKAMSYERMGKEAARLQAEIEALLTKAGMVDAEEDERWGEDFRGDELPEELQRREKRLAAIQAAKARLEAAQRGRDDERGREPGQDRNPRGGRPYKRAYGEPEPKAQSNFTDPESQIMLVDALLEARTPTLYLGLGAFERVGAMGYPELPERDRRLLERAALVTVRDEACAALLAPLAPILLPCPSLFAAPEARPRGPSRRIALSMQGVGERNPQRIGRETFDFAHTLFAALAERHECALVCHYIDEVADLRPLFGDQVEIRYAYDAADYLGLYDSFDLTVTTRVHGAGLAASLGIPGFLIGHSPRAATAEGFRTIILDPKSLSVDAALGLIQDCDVTAASRALAAHKEAAREATLGHLLPALRDLGLAT